MNFFFTHPPHSPQPLTIDGTLMWELYKQSRSLLGMNARNLKYVRPFNPARGKRIADHKLLCKRVLGKNGLPVPKLLGKIRTQTELENFDWSKLPESFALKPNRGFGGSGILIVYARKKGRDDAWVKTDGSIVTIEDLESHIQNILDGSFSLSNSPDVAFFEERLKLLKLFKPYSWKGIPDIRVIVFNRVPVMAMLRLPTKESDGKANLQHGALGLGIDLSSGVTTTAIQGVGAFGRLIVNAPGTRMVLSGVRIPYWKDILKMAVRAQEVSSLGFLGADVAIDRDLGPVILELNARPGLSIQLANMAGLKERLERVQGLKIKSTDHGVRVGMDLFGGEIEEEIEELSGRRVIGPVEKVKFIGKDGKEIEVEAKIDTGADSSSIDRSLAEELGFIQTLNYFDAIETPPSSTREENDKTIDGLRKKYLTQDMPDLKDLVFVHSASGMSLRPKIGLKMIINEQEIEASPTIIDRSQLAYRAIIGRRNLRQFLVDVAKPTGTPLVTL
ncbi:MAG: sugar-transfer associated ATP-grasp domain-containing protein [Candidatus Moraniibacteriota bacterium]